MPLTFMRDVIVPDLRKLGYQVVPCKDLASTLTAGLEPLQEVESGSTGRHGQTTLCSFEHFLNLLWLPLIEFLETSANGGSIVWTKTLALHQKALLLEMQGVVVNAEEPLDMDSWIQFVQGTLQRLFGSEGTKWSHHDHHGPSGSSACTSHTSKCIAPSEIIIVLQIGWSCFGFSGASDDPC